MGKLCCADSTALSRGGAKIVVYLQIEVTIEKERFFQKKRKKVLWNIPKYKRRKFILK
jgi:hypothetical protein